jgi:hypothetical protein
MSDSEQQDSEAMRAELHARLAPAGQGHVLQHWAELTPEQQQSLAADVRGFDFGFVGRVFAASMAGDGQQGAAAVSPCDQVLRLEVRFSAGY